MVANIERAVAALNAIQDMYSKEDGPIEHVPKLLLRLLLPSPLPSPHLQEAYQIASVQQAMAALNATQDMYCKDKDVPMYVSRREHLHLQDSYDDPLPDYHLASVKRAVAALNATQDM